MLSPDGFEQLVLAFWLVKPFSKAGHGSVVGRSALGVCFWLCPALGSREGKAGAVGSAGGVVAGSCSGWLACCLTAESGEAQRSALSSALKSVFERVVFSCPRWEVFEKDKWEFMRWGCSSQFEVCGEAWGGFKVL